MNIEMKNGKVLVEPIDQPASSVIVTPDTAHRRSQHGIVRAVGEGKLRPNGTREAVDVRIGDHVMFRPEAPVELKLDGKIMMVVEAVDLLGIVEDTDGPDQ